MSAGNSHVHGIPDGVEQTTQAFVLEDNGCIFDGTKPNGEKTAVEKSLNNNPQKALLANKTGTKQIQQHLQTT